MIIKDSRQYELRVTPPQRHRPVQHDTGYTQDQRTVAVGANDVRLEELESEGSPLDVTEQGQLMLEPEVEYQLVAKRNVRGWTSWGAATGATLPVPRRRTARSRLSPASRHWGRRVRGARCLARARVALSPRVSIRPALNAPPLSPAACAYAASQLALCLYKFNCSELIRACMVKLAKFRKKKDEIDETIINEFIGETVA